MRVQRTHRLLAPPADPPYLVPRVQRGKLAYGGTVKGMQQLLSPYNVPMNAGNLAETTPEVVIDRVRYAPDRVPRPAVPCSHCSHALRTPLPPQNNASRCF